MTDILDNLYALSESDRCKVFVTALRNLQTEADDQGSVTREDIDRFLETAANGYWSGSSAPDSEIDKISHESGSAVFPLSPGAARKI